MKISTSPDKVYEIDNERKALMRLSSSPHVIQLLENPPVIDTKCNTSFAMEYAPHGDLFDYVRDKKFDETLARTYFRQLIQGLKSCHEVGVFHRDIKLENLLLDWKFDLKLADFGASYLLTEDVLITGQEPLISGVCGTLGFQAIEINSSSSMYLGSAVDIWSAGCTLFSMLTASHAFSLYSNKEKWRDPQLSMIKEGDFDGFWQFHFGSPSSMKLKPIPRLAMGKIFIYRFIKNELKFKNIYFISRLF